MTDCAPKPLYVLQKQNTFLAFLRVQLLHIKVGLQAQCKPSSKAFERDIMNTILSQYIQLWQTFKLNLHLCRSMPTPPPPRFSGLLFLLSIYSFTNFLYVPFSIFCLNSRFVFLLSSPPPFRSDYYLCLLDEKKLKLSS